MIEWGGALRWMIVARRVGGAGAAMLGVGARRSCDAVPRSRQIAGVFQPLPRRCSRCIERLKQIFDPHDILNRGRLYAAF